MADGWARNVCTWNLNYLTLRGTQVNTHGGLWPDLFYDVYCLWSTPLVQHPNQWIHFVIACYVNKSLTLLHYSAKLYRSNLTWSLPKPIIQRFHCKHRLLFSDYKVLVILYTILFKLNCYFSLIRNVKRFLPLIPWKSVSDYFNLASY